MGHTETIEYDERCALPKKQTGPNGLSTSWQYDGFCRKIKETRADGTNTTWKYEFAKAGEPGPFVGDYSVYSVTEESSGTPPKTVYFDSLEREVRTKTLGFNGKLVYGDKVYNAKGQIDKATLPYYEGEFLGDNTYWITTAYDALGRKTMVSRPSESEPIVTTYGYAGLSSWEINPKGFKKTTTKNVQGKPVKVEEFNESTISYSYDALGNLISSDANGFRITNSYDDRGNKVAMSDPSMGNWSYQYNAFGELIKQTDAKGQVTIQEYDKLGRMIKRIDNDGTTEWLFDIAPNGIGKLAQEIGENSAKVYTYDELGRQINLEKIIGDQHFHTTNDYDEFSRLKTVSMPDGVEHTREYEHGQLKRITMPKRQIWDYDYLQLEKALEDFAGQILVLEEKIYQHRTEQLKHQELADKLRLSSIHWQTKADDLDDEAATLRSNADRLQSQADAHKRKADYYRSRGAHYTKLYGNAYFKYVGMSGGRLQFRNTKNLGCAAYDKKGKCKRYAYKHSDVYVDPATIGTSGCISRSNFKGIPGPCNKWQGSPGVVWGGKLAGVWKGRTQLRGRDGSYLQGLYPGRFYNGLADKEYELKNHYQSLANDETVRAEQVEDAIQEYESRAEADKQKALDEYKLARAAADEAREYQIKLDDLMEAQDQVQRQIDEHNNSDEVITIWAATSRDAQGRLAGEYAGNALVTHRIYDPYSGQLKEIKTGVDMDNPVRHLTYEYDVNNNVTSRNDHVNKVEETFRYDSFDRLIYADAQNEGNNYIYAYEYDVRGNMTAKSDAGQMIYDAANRLKQLIRTNGETSDYTYDANGNQLTGNNREITWNSFNKVRQVRSSDGKSFSSFEYGTDRMRIRQTDIADGNRITTLYVDKGFEQVTRIDKDGKTITDSKHYIYAEGQMVAIHIRGVDHNGEKIPDVFRYLHRDALNSIDTITNAQGLAIDRMSYDPFGKRREINGAPIYDIYKPTLTNRGYTGHEHMDNLGLIHMNARLYDPETARFLSADIYIQEPGMSQSHNRYIYVIEGVHNSVSS